MGSAARDFWGKLSADEPRTAHPLICHLLDTGHVMAQLWHCALMPTVRRQLAGMLQLPEDMAGRWLAFARTPLGWTMIVAFPATLLLWLQLRAIWFPRRPPEPEPFVAPVPDHAPA